MEAVDTKKRFASTVKGAASVAINHSVTSDDKGVQTIFSPIRKDSASVGYLNYGRDGDRVQIFFEPFTATTAKEKKAIVTTILADLDELLTTTENNG
jgi:hypothetical protein